MHNTTASCHVWSVIHLCYAVLALNPQGQRPSQLSKDASLAAETKHHQSEKLQTKVYSVGARTMSGDWGLPCTEPHYPLYQSENTATAQCSQKATEKASQAYRTLSRSVVRKPEPGWKTFFWKEALRDQRLRRCHVRPRLSKSFEKSGKGTLQAQEEEPGTSPNCGREIMSVWCRKASVHYPISLAITVC